MIRIAICDDEVRTLRDISDRFARYGEKNGQKLSIDQYSQAKELAAQIRTKDYQIFILDMLMPHMGGIEIGQMIRKRDEQAVIIYLTSSMDFAYQAFGVFAQRYLLKPIKEKELNEAMDFAVSQALLMQKALHINTAKGIQQILYQDIEYVENAARALHVFTIDGKETVSRLLRNSFEKDMELLLENEDFIQTHKSFIVNLSHVRLYGQNQMTMRSGAQIPISKSRQAEVKRGYLSYISCGY